MNFYIAIGHWGEGRDTITSLVNCNHTMKDFRRDLKGNGFIPYVVLTEKRFQKMLEAKNADECFGLFDLVKSLTSNYRVWNLVTEYIEQCDDIIQEKLDKAKADEICGE